MRAIFRCLALLFLNALLCAFSFAQQDTTAQQPRRIILADGSELIGTIVAEDSVSIHFKTAGDISMSIPKSQIKSIEVLSGQISDGTYLRHDPNHTRLFFSPTARPLKSGQGYFSAYQIFFPMLAVGVGDIVTLAGGISLFPGAKSELFYLAPKVTPVNIDRFSLSGGVLYINSIAGESKGVGILYGVGTYGTNNSSLTAGLGWGFSGDDIADDPVLMLGGDLRVSNSIKFITENWILPNSEVQILTFGIRFFGERLAADLGLIYPAGSEIEGFPFFPWLGFAYNLGGGK